MGKTGIIHIYPTHIQVEMDNPYPTQIQWVWIWVRVVGTHWQLDSWVMDKFNSATQIICSPVLLSRSSTFFSDGTGGVFSPYWLYIFFKKKQSTHRYVELKR